MYDLNIYVFQASTIFYCFALSFGCKARKYVLTDEFYISAYSATLHIFYTCI
jgi:hypothetical protein